MERLSEATFQSCHLMVASGSDMVVVARVESPDMLGFGRSGGLSPPVESISVGAGAVCLPDSGSARSVAGAAVIRQRPQALGGHRARRAVHSGHGVLSQPQQVRGRRNRHRGSDYRRQERNGHRDPGHALYRRAFRQAESDASGHGDAAGRPKNQPRALAGAPSPGACIRNGVRGSISDHNARIRA